MIRGYEVSGGADAATAAAIVAALVRLDEEYAAAAASPPIRLAQGQWVLSTMPRPVQPIVAARPTPSALGWSVSSDDGDEA